MANRTSTLKKIFAILLTVSLVFGVLSTVAFAADGFGEYYSHECEDCDGHGGILHDDCADCEVEECGTCGGDGWFGLIPCFNCDGGYTKYEICDKHTCTSCSGYGRIYYAEHLDIRFDVHATVVVNGEPKNVNFNISANDYREGRITVSGGRVDSLGSDTSGDQNDLRLNGYFPIGTPDNPVEYTVTLSNKKIMVDGVEVTFSSTINNITAWGFNTCPSGVGIDVAFGNVDGTPETPELTSGSLTIYKYIDGVTVAEDETFTFTLTDLDDPTAELETVTVVVPAGNNAGSTTVELPFGTYTVAEATPEDIVIGEDTYEFKSASINYPDGATSFTLSKTGFARQVNVINTYEKAIPAPPPITEGDITITKIISGATPAEAATYSFTVGSTPVEITVPAGETTASVTVTLPFGTYAVAEITDEMADITGTDGLAYEFVSATAAQNVTISAEALTGSASITNTYEKKITDGTVTIVKTVAGVTLPEDTTFTFTVGGETVEVTVKAGETSGSATITLPLGTYAVAEITEGIETIVDAENELYELAATTGDTEVELTKAQTEDTASITNTYVHKVTKGDLLVTAVIAGATPAADTVYQFTVVGENTDLTVDVTVPAGQTSASVSVEDLPLGTYTVTQLKNDAELTGTDGLVYNFTGLEQDKTTATITAETGDSVAATNSYEQKITEGTLTIVKRVEGMVLAEDTEYTFKVTGDGFEEIFTVVVPAGQEEGMAEFTIPFGQFTLVEIIGEDHTAVGTDGLTYVISAIHYDGDSFENTEEFNTPWVYAINEYTEKVVETDPEETDPEETDPEETDPEETDPEETDPEETDPEETDPEETDPEETDPEETDPEETDPEETDPVETEPKDPWNPIDTFFPPDETDPVETDPVETDPAEEIPDEPVPIDDDVPVETDPAETDPIDEIPDDDVPLTDIPDEDVPQTGFSILWYALALLSGTGLTVVTTVDKKKKENE